MKRVAEPELMDGAAQARAYAEADFSEANTLFCTLFAQAFPAFADGQVVDLGCGPADICIRLAGRYPRCRITALDGAGAMLALAEAAVHRAGLAARIRLVKCTLGLGTSCAPAGADAVVSNSLLHHLADPQVLWEAVQEIGAPGASLLFMDLMRPASPAEVKEQVQTYAGDAPEVLRTDFRNSLRAAYTPSEVRGQLARAGLRNLEVSEASDRHLVVSGVLGGA